MMLARHRSCWFRRATTLATWFVAPSIPALLIAACAASEETDAPEDKTGVVIPSTDGGDEASSDANSEADVPDPCAAGGLCPTPTPLEMQHYVIAIRGRSKDDVWASGSGGLLMHWDGKQWADVHSGMNTSLSTLVLTAEETWGVSGATVMRRRLDPESVRTATAGYFVLNATGTGADVRKLADMAILPNGEVYLSPLPDWRGPASSTGRSPLAKFDFDTETLTYLPDPVHPLTKKPQITSARAHFLVPDKALWVVGDRGSVTRYPISSVGEGDGGASPVGQGVVVPLASQPDLLAAWGHDEHLWAAGTNGTVVHFDGTEWHTEATDTKVTLRAIFGVGPNDIWAVGDRGTALHFDGNAWSHVDVGAYDGNLSAVWGSASDDVWIGGESVMFHWGARP